MSRRRNIRILIQRRALFYQAYDRIGYETSKVGGVGDWSLLEEIELTLDGLKAKHWRSCVNCRRWANVSWFDGLCGLCFCKICGGAGGAGGDTETQYGSGYGDILRLYHPCDACCATGLAE